MSDELLIKRIKSAFTPMECAFIFGAVTNFLAIRKQMLANGVDAPMSDEEVEAGMLTMAKVISVFDAKSRAKMMRAALEAGISYDKGDH
jgi:hypothetical protein